MTIASRYAIVLVYGHLQFMKNINVYAHKPGPLSKAFLQVVGLTNATLVEVADQKSADLILLTGLDDLRALYTPTQFFCVLLIRKYEIAANQPANVCFINPYEPFLADGSLEKMAVMIEKHMVAKPALDVATPEFTDIVRCAKCYSVLVIDDTEANLRIAKAVLVGHTVVTANRLQQAVGLMNSQQFDTVLTDMEMLPDKLYQSLSLDHYGVTETVPYGFAAILEATERGIPVAVVTDGNHHAGWVSAMFDTKKGATVNGQKVLFMNDIGKRWDMALKRLMEE